MATKYIKPKRVFSMKLKLLISFVLICCFLTGCQTTGSDNPYLQITSSAQDDIPINLESSTTDGKSEVTFDETPIQNQEFADNSEVSTLNKKLDAKFDGTDEILAQGQEFAKNFSDMIWNYMYGAAWEDYVNIKYFDFENKSEDNYVEVEAEEFEGRKVPFYKLLITDYTYDELLEYIKSFFAENMYYKIDEIMEYHIIGKDNFIFVNGNEPTFLYPIRNKRAHIIRYTINSDNTITYDCFAESTEETDDDLYFSFTLCDGKICADFYYSEMNLFNEAVYAY